MRQNGTAPFVVAALIISLCICYAVKEFSMPVAFQWKVSLVPSKIRAGEFWRILSSPFFHTNISHLLLNLLILFQIGGSLETNLGHFGLILHGFIITVLCGITYTICTEITTLFDFYKTYNSPILGMSGIILALCTVDVFITEQSFRSIFFVFYVPAKLFPYCMLVAFSIALPHCSILNLIVGLAVGTLYSKVMFKSVPKKGDIKREKNSHYIATMGGDLCQSPDNAQSAPFALFTLSWLDRDKRHTQSDKI